jgi:hypothetical protein
MIVSDDVNDDDNMDDGMEFDEYYVEVKEGDLENAKGATFDGDCCTELEATDGYFNWKGQDEAGFYTHSMQMAKYSDMFVRFIREERHTLNILNMSVWTIKQQLLDRHIYQDQQIQHLFLLLIRLCTYNSKHSSNIGLSVFFCTFVCCSEQCENIFLGSSSMITKGSLKPAQNSYLFYFIY